ncbi:MAG TPA: NTP transferase domain-containing protein [Nitriliruptoraceae bacterium]|nr:NTP transferase domain-containing protein [Nitriliruptoraceae bacterium]
MVLAAGTGRRFGGPKQLARVAGQPLVGHVVATMLDAGLDVMVAVGPRADVGSRAVADAAHAAGGSDRGGRVATVEVADAATGMGTSLAVAAEAAGPRPLVVALADQPGLVVDDVIRVVDALAAGAPAARIRHPDGPGHPVGFGSAAHGALVSLAGTGATGREVLAELDVEQVVVTHPRPRDVDTPRDLVEVIAAWPGRASAP